MKSSNNDSKLEANNTSESLEFSEFTNKDIYSDIFQSENKLDNNKDSENFKDYLSLGYDNKPDILDLKLMINN